MSTQKRQPQNNQDSDFQSCDSDQSINIVEQVQNAIRQLPNLQDKIQAIAINYYTIQKRQLQEKLQIQKTKLQFKTRNTFNAQIQQIYALIQNQSAITQTDYQFIFENKTLLKQGQLQQIQKIMKGQYKLQKESNQFNQYWLKCLLHSQIISEQIHEKDQEVLKNLYKITAYKNQDNTKLTVSFFFKPNKWFSNQKISKQFKINKDGQPVKSIGDQIQWKQGMNYTITVIKSKNKKKNKKAQKQQTVKQPSFFHYFQSISCDRQQNQNLNNEDQWEDLMEDLQVQHELSVHIYEDLIPKSLEFYLGCGTDASQIKQDQLNVIKETNDKKQQSDGNQEN